MSGASSVADLVAPGQRVLLDSSTVIAYFDRAEIVSPVASWLIEHRVSTGVCDAVISTATVAELLDRPIRAGRAAVDRFVGFLDSLEALQIRSVDFLVAAEAARMRTEAPLELPDALILATAVLTSCDVVVTNDRTMARAARDLLPEKGVVLLSEVAAV